MIETYGRNFRVVLREEKANEKCFIFNGDIMAIREPLKEGKDIYFRAFNNEYDEKMNHKLDNKKDIMKVYDECGNLLWDRKEEENKVDWRKISTGTEVEYFANNKWEKAYFVLFDLGSGTILMTDGQELICNHTAETVRLKNKEMKKENKKNRKDIKKINIDDDIEDIFNKLITLMGK